MRQVTKKIIRRAWFPAFKPAARFLIEGLGSDMSQQIYTRSALSNVLRLQNAPTYDLIHRRFDKGGRNSFVVVLTIAMVRRLPTN